MSKHVEQAMRMQIWFNVIATVQVYESLQVMHSLRSCAHLCSRALTVASKKTKMNTVKCQAV